MNLPTRLLIHNTPTETELLKAEQVCSEYQNRSDTLDLIAQLNQLVKAVQRHRGMTMALIGGNQGFREDFGILQYQLDRRVTTLEVFIGRNSKIISTQQKESVRSAWQTIRQDWQDDKLSDNFGLHSHFVEQLQAMVIQLAKSLETPFYEPPSIENQPYPQTFKRIELLNFIARELPEMVEQVAQVRGLATFVAATKEADYLHDRKLRFVLQCVKQKNEKLRHQSERLSNILAGSMKQLSSIKTIELKLHYLIETVNGDVLGGAEIQTNSDHIFSVATEIIDVYWKAIDEGLGLLRRWHEEMLEAWLKQGGAQL